MQNLILFLATKVTVELLAGYWSNTIGQTAETIAMFEDT